MPHLKAVSAYTRKLKEGVYWYASWHEDGTRVVRPTGVTWNPRRRDGGRAEAIEAGRKLRDEREAGRRKPGEGEVPTFSKHAGGFYALDGAYLKRQADKGKRLNAHWANSLQAMIDKYVIPRWGETRLDSFNAVEVENWLVDLPLSSQTRRHLLYGCLRVPLREAARERIIALNPLELVEPPVKESRKRDILSMDELRLLFPSTWEALVAVWGQPKYAALFMTMATTGIREGEIRVLQWRHVLPNGWLTIERAVKIDGTIGALKKRERSGEPRVVALPARTQSALVQWRAATPFKGRDDLVFCGDGADHVLNRRTFQDVFARALDGEHRGDVSKLARVAKGERYLTPHSLRHTYNTMMRRSIPADALLALMGHRDSRMSEHYDHPEIADRIKALEGVRNQIETALSW
ncbi:MAG: site-specific integrase [Spirochaetia bacterium]|jgi:integrase